MAEAFKHRPHVKKPGDPFPEGRWCMQCSAFQDEPPKEKCSNPDWHNLRRPEAK